MLTHALLALCLAATPAPAPAASSPAADAPLIIPTPDLADFLSGLISPTDPAKQADLLPGITAFAVRNGQVIARASAGVRALGSPDPIAPTDLWHIGSCTKAMTATLCALLVERGTLRWDLTLAEAFPDLAPTMHPDFKSATLEHLLTNRAGLPSNLDQGDLWAKLWQHRGTPRQGRELLASTVLTQKPQSTPGTAFLYSNASFALAGHIAERATGSTFEDLITAELFRPLGITSAGFGAPGAPNPTGNTIDQPRGHRGAGAAAKPVPPGPEADNPPAIAPAGTVHLSAEDWSKFLALHARGERDGWTNPDGSFRIRPETFRKLHTPPADNAGSDYAFGWGSGTRPWAGTDGKPGRILTHAGSNTMWFAVAWVAPQTGEAFLACVNTAGPAATRAADATVARMVRAARGTHADSAR